VYWENAPDHRTSRTLDWLNDACEAKLGKENRQDGKVTYAILMSPLSIGFDDVRFDWKHPLAQANRAKLRPGKRAKPCPGKKGYTGKFPISLLLTKEPETVQANPEIAQANGATGQFQPYVLIGAMQRFGRRAAVGKYKYEKTEIRRDPGQAPDDFWCRLYVRTGIIDVRFTTKFEADALVKCKKAKKLEPEAQSDAAESAS
jgi:hypothetical protein